jgi:hypothetical protein
VFFIGTDGPNMIGSGSGGFGVLGLSGYALELDVVNSGPCDPGNGNHAGVDLLSSCSSNCGVLSPIATSPDLFDVAAPNNGVGDIGDGTWREAWIQFVSGQLTLAITDSSGTLVAVPNLQGVTLPGFVAGTHYYLGFGGGTGSNALAARQEIRDVAVMFGSTHCL